MSTNLDAITGLRILIVEDEALIVEEMADRLTRAGCEVVATTDNGHGAIEAAITLRPDLILMDVRLKDDMDGIHASELIQRQLSVPIVYLTAHSDHGTLRRVKARGASGYIQKPFHIRNLISAIDVAVHRFKMERQLEESLLTYAAILASSSDAVIATDVNGRVRFMNPAAERLTRWPIRDAQGQPSTAVVRFVSTGGESGDHPVGRVLASRDPVTLGADEHLVSRYGIHVPIDGGISAVIDSLGRLVGATITLRDVTDARNATEDLQDAAERLRAVVDTAVDGVMLLDAPGRILMFNAACPRLFGYSAKELARCAFSTLMPDFLTEDLNWPPMRDQQNIAMPSKITARPTIGRRKDGSTFPAELSLGKASHGGQSVFVSVIRDVSERKELEAALIDAIGHEQRRLADDLHDGLGQELTGLSLLLSAFARSVRHGEILEATDLERALEVAQHALQSCRSIARGLSPVTETQGGLIAGLRELVARLKTGSGPTLDFTTIGVTRLGLSPAASDHLFRIAQEAIANALKHAHANSIKVTLDIEPASVRLEICDDGEGLTVPEISATGLGLRTMRYRASLLGAKFHITRFDHAGTCVVCECPQAA
jgi:PAS domain S-box-containing protein